MRMRIHPGIQKLKTSRNKEAKIQAIKAMTELQVLIVVIKLFAKYTRKHNIGI
jgi:hypothetical protein